MIVSTNFFWNTLLLLIYRYSCLIFFFLCFTGCLFVFLFHFFSSFLATMFMVYMDGESPLSPYSTFFILSLISLFLSSSYNMLSLGLIDIYHIYLCSCLYICIYSVPPCIWLLHFTSLFIVFSSLIFIILAIFEDISCCLQLLRL